MLGDKQNVSFHTKRKYHVSLLLRTMLERDFSVILHFWCLMSPNYFAYTVGLSEIDGLSLSPAKWKIPYPLGIKVALAGGNGLCWLSDIDLMGGYWKTLPPFVTAGALPTDPRNRYYTSLLPILTVGKGRPLPGPASLSFFFPSLSCREAIRTERDKNCSVCSLGKNSSRLFKMAG